MQVRDATVLVTGGAGFLGRRVCQMLEDRGAGQIIVPRRAEYDLTQQDAARTLIAEQRPDLVLHLAAEVGGIGANQANPGRYFYANMAMGLHLIEASREHGVRKFVQVGTVCAYPKHTPVPFHEDALWDGYPEETNAPYGVAKKALLVMLQGYRQQYGFNGIYLLPVNLYGPGDNFDLATSHVIPALIRKFIAARDASAPSVEVWGTGAASREFLYVDDAARGIVTAAAEYDDPDPVNLGAGEEITIRHLVEVIAKLTGYAGDIVWDTSRPDGQPRRMLDTSRARERFGFEAQVGLEAGLRATIEWWSDHRG
ncbi:MAG TPA: GDP-L-fucose synthase [Euzebyales bacterium]|nr:GDP-L-fucose synthase [Euzebyales bacterium]